MKRISIQIIIFLFSLIPVPIWAQISDDGNHIGKALESAKEMIELDDFKNAYIQLLSLYQLDSTNPELNYYLGYSSFMSNRDKNVAFPFLQAGTQFSCNAYFFLGQIKHGQEQFDEAKQFFNRYKSCFSEEKMFNLTQVDDELDKIRVAKDKMLNRTYHSVENMGDQVNSTYPDYAPLIFANGQRLYFTSRRQGIFAEKDPNMEYFEDVFVSERVNEQWQTPVNLGLPVNSKTHDATVALSKTEDTLFIYRTSENLVGGDILFTYKLDQKWQNPIPFSGRINSTEGSEASMCFHPSGERIYFSSNRAGGFGGKDLYCVQKLPNGEWSLPTNLGGLVNTAQDEDGPFLSQNGQTLYFSSKGHENMGGYDLFVCQWTEDEQWSEPINMGYPINSVGDDIYLSTINNEDYFFSSNRNGGFGFADIYQTKFPKEKVEYIVVKGRSIDDQSQEAIASNITVYNQETNQLVGIYKADPASGKFVLILKPGDTYKILVEAKDYYNQVESIDLSRNMSLDDVLKTLRLKKNQP